LIARFPSQIPAASRISAFGHVTDVVPTILEAVGVDMTSASSNNRYELDGSSLWSIMTGARDAAHPQTESIGYELMGNSALYRGDFKIVRDHTKPWKLFDIERDPGETANLATTRPTLYGEMLREYERYEERMGVVPVPADYDVMRQLLKSPNNDH